MKKGNQINNENIQETVVKIFYEKKKKKQLKQARLSRRLKTLE